MLPSFSSKNKATSLALRLGLAEPVTKHPQWKSTPLTSDCRLHSEAASQL